MELKIMRLCFENIEMPKRDIPKIRGFIANKFSQYEELHNHKGEKNIYGYPIIQYKAIHHMPCILGINEGIDIIKKIETEIDTLNIGNNILNIYEKQIKYGICNTLLKYKFDSPWMCLNENNFKIYKKSNEEEKTQLLKSILIGNILSMSKRFKYTVDEKIIAYLNLQPCGIRFKNKDMLGFKGEFITNFKIPDYMAVGKSVSRGFGTVKYMGNFDFK